MYLNTIFRIYPTKKEETILKQLIVNFENQVNKVIKLFQENGSIKNIPFKEIDNDIPWDSKIEVIKQAINVNLRMYIYDHLRMYNYSTSSLS